MIEAVLLLLLGLLLTGLIIAANGYFVAQEFAYMSVDRATLRVRAEQGDAASKRALAITRRTSFMLSGAQLGITVTGLLVGYVAEPFIGASLGILLGGAGVPTAVGIAIGTVVALVLATVVQMVFGELFPKNLAIASPEPLARGLARSTQLYLAAFGWLIALFDAASNAMLRLLRVEPVHDIESSATAEDLEHIIDDSRSSGDLPPDLSILLDRILDFPDRDAEHAMIPRARVDAVAPELPIAEMRVRMVHGHTRYPVLGEADDPIGVVHLGDVLAAAPDATAPISTIMREPVVVPTLMPLPEVLESLSGRGEELACVIDEYGGFAGVVTVEDLAEELVGEITDEHDDPSGDAAVLDGDGSWLVEGDMHIDELERTIGRDLPRGDYETVSGMLIAHVGGLPEAGDRLLVELPATGAEVIEREVPRWVLQADVERVERHVPSLVRVALSDAAATDDETQEEQA